mgnify:FL=1|jgi:hypothetical protein
MFFYLWYECKFNNLICKFCNSFPSYFYTNNKIPLVDIDISMYDDDDWDKV